MKEHLSSQSKINDAIRFLTELPANGAYSIDIKKLPKKRTTQQNKALYTWAKLTSEELNATGQNIQKVLKHAIDVDWTKELVLELLWRRIQVVITGKKSTTEPTSEEYILIYDNLNRHLGDKCGVHIPWPIRNNRRG